MSKEKFINDPWAKTKTRNNLPGDEVISALQKSIRKGYTQEACEFAYEMYITSPQYEDKLWRRLLAISVEDIGFGNPEASIYVNNLNQMRREFAYNEADRVMFVFHAIRILTESTKDRSTDLLKNIVIKSFAMGYVPEIPDYALDKHTTRGKEMGRDSFHFLNDASQVHPQLEVDNNYKETYEKILEKYNPDNTVESAFEFNPWQI
jgi:replication-associated recombination protein RarA